MIFCLTPAPMKIIAFTSGIEKEIDCCPLLTHPRLIIESLLIELEELDDELMYIVLESINREMEINLSRTSNSNELGN